MPKEKVPSELKSKLQNQAKTLSHPVDEIADTLKVKESKTVKVQNSLTPQLKQFNTQKLPKYKTLRPIQLRLRDDQIEFLDRLERRIMSERWSGKERITKNTILRTLVDILKEIDITTREITDETELFRKIRNTLIGGNP